MDLVSFFIEKCFQNYFLGNSRAVRTVIHSMICTFFDMKPIWTYWCLFLTSVKASWFPLYLLSSLRWSNTWTSRWAFLQFLWVGGRPLPISWKSLDSLISCLISWCMKPFMSSFEYDYTNCETDSILDMSSWGLSDAKTCLTSILWCS